MDTDKIRAGLPQVRQALIRACNGKARTSIPVRPTDDDQVLWQAAEDLEAAANELDTLRAENARLVGLVGALRGEIALTRAFVEGVALAIVNAKRLTKETCLRQITQISDKLSQMLGESEETE